ncbi:MAG: single-stranded DNA-binding protein [Bacteroidota bacterium]
MKTLRNKVQLIGHVGENPKTHTFESGKKVIRFSLATNDYYLKDGEKVQQTEWHNVVAWGKNAELIEKYVFKGSEIAVDGKLTSRAFENQSGEQQYITEILVNEILLLDSKGNQKEKN